MTYKEKMDWLGRYRQAMERQYFLQQEILRLRSEAEGVASAMETVPNSGPRRTDRLPRMVEKIEEAEKILEKQVETCLESRLRVTGAISRVQNPARREVLRLRYLEGLTYAAIADEIGLVERQVYRLHRRGVEEIETEKEKDVSQMSL